MRTIEHASFIDDECIDLALENGTYIVPTFIVYEVMARSESLSQEQRDLAARVLNRKAESFLKAAAAGVRWGVGTDAGSFMPRGRLWEELRIIHGQGVAAETVLRAATLTNAQILQAPDVGSFHAGAWADMVVVPSDPLVDLTVLGQPTAVI